jgi:hypothetical protein
MADENRRDQRYRANLSVLLTRGKEQTRLLTDDVSFRGAFLRTDLPAAIRQLVRVEFTLPDHHLVGGHAMVVHVLPPSVAREDKDHIPGIGVQFWGEVSGRSRWDSFIQELTKDPSLKVVPPPGSPDPVRRSSSRFRIKLEVRLPELPETLALATRDISEDGMSVATDANYPPGLKTRLVLVHPSTAEAFPIDVIVRRHIKELDFTGLGVEFMDKSPDTRARLRTFLRIPREDIELVPEDDAELQ